MQRYAHPPEDVDDIPLAEPSEIDMPYTLATAFDLWTAYRDHGVLPHAGGYLDQPRQWRHMIREMNRRYDRAYRNKDEQLLDESTLPSDTPPVTFANLMRG